MTTGYQIKNRAGAFYFTFTVVDWVDVFTRKKYRDIILESLTYCRKRKGLLVWGYVIMSNHMHCILSATNLKLPEILHDFKSHTAKAILEAIQDPGESRQDWMLKRFEFAARKNVRNSQHQFWMHRNRAIELISPGFIKQKLNYIHQNPVKAGWVEKPEDWLYSSARNYCYQWSLIEIDMLDIGL